MRTILVLGLLTAACVSAAPPAEEDGDASVAARTPWPEPDLSQAKFFTRTPGSSQVMKLLADAFTATVQTGPHAIRTHLSITMRNPGREQLEAVMRLPIPPGAAVTRAVLWVNSQPVEGAFVARDRARAIYRSITERRRDPALIAWSGPDWIDVSVFPVEATGQRQLELEWIEPTGTVEGKVGYRIPVLAHEGRPVAYPEKLIVDGTTVARQGRTWLTLPAPPLAGSATVAREPGNPFGYVFSPAKVQDDGPVRIVLVAETSAAMQPEDRKRQRKTLDELLAALPDSTQLDFLAVDWKVRSLAEANSPTVLRKKLGDFDAIPSAGALDLQNALSRAGERAELRHATCIVFLGRGRDAFAGDATGPALRRMQAAGQMLIVVGAGPAASPLRDVAALTGGQDLALSQTAQVARLLSAIHRTQPSLTVADAEPFFPLETVTGETRWLTRYIGKVPDGASSTAVRDLEALWTRAHVAGTTDRETDLGTRQHVLTPLTSILVLESNADYERWGIPVPGMPDAPQNAGLLGLGMAGKRQGLETVLGRSTAGGNGQENVLGNLVSNEIGSAYGIGGLGVVGTGASGAARTRVKENTAGGPQLGLRGYGSGFVASRNADGLSMHPAGTPQVSSGFVQARGSLDKDIIRRVVRLHMNEVKYCYDQELVRKPELSGRVVVQFVIAATGQVLSSTINSTTLGNARVEQCLTAAVRRWPFPAPSGGGIVLVSFPFNFFQDDNPADRPIAIPRSMWDTAMEALREKARSTSRLAKVADALGMPKEDRPLLLAWRVIERHLRQGQPPAMAYLLTATLLKEARHLDDAVRILSEAAPSAPDMVAAELGRWGQSEESARVEALKTRGARP